MATNEQEFLAHIKKREGTEFNVKNEHISYEDKIKPQGYLTGGYGHILSKDEITAYPRGTPIPIEVVDQWLVNDTRKAIAAARKQAEEMNDSVTESFIYGLADVNFQLGTSWCTKNADGSSGGFKKTCAALKEGDYDTVIANIEFSDPEDKNNKALTGWNTQTPKRVANFKVEVLELKAAINGLKFAEGQSLSLGQLEKNVPSILLSPTLKQSSKKTKESSKNKLTSKNKAMVKEYSQYGK
jgi:GH24 family phage-related lysozyme (muramidase)